MSDILAEMRGVLAGHAEECGVRADQMMIDGRLYPDEIADWAQEVARLQRIAAAAAAYRLTYEQQQEQRRTGVFTFRAADYNARNEVRAALFAALDEQH